MIRAANSGVTFVTDPLGRITTQLPQDQVAVVDVVPDLPLEGGTIFDVVGDWPFWAAVVLSIGLGWAATRRRNAA
jgi:apolipoprotein N-acyltransferase